MASNTGAYFEGMQYANKGVQPVNFGELSMGFAKIVEDKRAQEKQDRIRRENTQMEMQKLFGEEVYSAFDGTGLKDVDVVTAKIKDSIVARANVLNSMFEKGELTAPQMMQEMQKLNAQSKKISSFASSAAKSFEEIQGNTNSSAATEYLVQRANQLFQEATPVMDSSGKISFLSKDGDVMTNNPVDQLDRLLQNRNKFDVDNLAETIVNTQGQIRKTYENGQVITSKGEVGESQIEYISNLVNSMDAEDLFDIADQAGIEVEMDNASVFSIKNEDQVKAKVKKHLEDYTREKFKAKTSVDEVAGKQLSVQMQREYREAEKFKKQNEGAIVDIKEDGSVVAYPAQNKKINVTSLVIEGRPISAANIGSYSVSPEGEHQVTITYSSTEDLLSGMSPDKKAEVLSALSLTGEGGTTRNIQLTETLTIDNIAALNQIRAQLGMDLVDSKDFKAPEKKGANRFNK
jgi:hypothetical protein